MVFGEWEDCLQQATVSYSAASSTPRPNKKHTSPQRSPLVRVFEPKRARVGVAMPWNKVIWWVILLVSGLMAYVAYVTYLQLAPMD